MGASGKMSRQHGGQLCGFASVLGAAFLLVSLSPIPAADGGDSTPEVEIKIDPAQAQAAFVTAQKDLKDAVGERTVLQAE